MDRAIHLRLAPDVDNAAFAHEGARADAAGCPKLKSPTSRTDRPLTWPTIFGGDEDHASRISRALSASWRGGFVLLRALRTSSAVTTSCPSMPAQ